MRGRSSSQLLWYARSGQLELDDSIEQIRTQTSIDLKNYLEIQLKLHWWIKSVLKVFTLKMFPTFRSQSRTFFRGGERKIMQKHSYKQNAD